MTTVTWNGANGRSYAFQLYPWGTPFIPHAGVYIAARATPPNRWQALYVGESESLEDRIYTRLAYHDGMKRAHGQGATHIGVYFTFDDSERMRIESELIHTLMPPCNQQNALRGLMY